MLLSFCMRLLGCLSFFISPYDLGTRGSKRPLSSGLSSLIGTGILLSCVSDDHEYLFKGVHLLLMTSFQKHIANKQNVLVLYFVYCGNAPQGYTHTQSHSCMCRHVCTRAPKAPVLLDWNGAHHTFPWSIDLINCVSCWDPYHLMQHTPPAAKRSDPSPFSRTGPCSLNTEPLRMV